MNKIIIIVATIVAIFIGKKLFEMYKSHNMKVIKSDEKEIRKQELAQVEKELQTSGEQNVLPEAEKDLGQVAQPQPEI